VAKQIDDLGEDPTMKVNDAEYSKGSTRMLEIGLKQEQVTNQALQRENASSGML
jgi:hypothetical protein